jgi:hypothetical protein
LWVGLVLEGARHLGEGLLVRGHLLVARQNDACRRSRSLLERGRGLPARPCGARAPCRARRESAETGSPFASARRSPRRALAHAEDEQVGLRVEQDRAADLIGPVVVVRDAPERGLDAAEHDGHAGETPAGRGSSRRCRAVGARSPVRPPGEYWSSPRTFFCAVSLLSIESRLPAVMPTNRRGRPCARCRRPGSSQSGCAIMPTR